MTSLAPTHQNGARMRHAFDWLIRIILALIIPAFGLMWVENQRRETEIADLRHRLTVIEANRFTSDDAAELERAMRNWLETVRDNEIERAAETHGRTDRRLEILERR